MFVEESGPNLCHFSSKRNAHIWTTILFQFKCWKHSFQAKRGEKLQNFPGVVTSTRIPNCIWNKPNLLANTSLCSDSSQYTMLSQSLVQIGLIFLEKCLKTTVLFFIWAAWTLLNFYLKHKVFVLSFIEYASLISFHEGIGSIAKLQPGFNLVTLSITRIRSRSWTKVVDSMIFGIHCNTFFKQTSNFPKFSLKTSCDKT